MQALRNIYTVENHRIVIELPKSFNHAAVEIIILPLDPTNKETINKSLSNDKKERLKRLLAINVWNEDDIKPITDTQTLINQWKIEEF